MILLEKMYSEVQKVEAATFLEQKEAMTQVPLPILEQKHQQ
jgi:hypothetical protein